MSPRSAFALASAPLLVVLACSGGAEDDASASGSSSTAATEGGTSSTSAGESEGSGTEGDGVPACEGARLLPLPEDPAARGPWAVGAKTVVVADRRTEIWYPARPGSEADLPTVSYDLRLQLPPAEQGKIPDEANPFQPCACYRDLPLDDAHGPYPVIVFIHGTAGFRTQSLTFMTHWASRGFVVVASDHDGITLADVLGGTIDADQAGDARRVLDALALAEGEFAFLGGHLDLPRIGMSGHSAGGMAIQGLGDRAQVLIPMAAGGVEAGAALLSTMVLGGMEDKIVAFGNQQSGYDDSPAQKRLVGLQDAGHLAFSDLCVLGADQGGILQIALDYGVEVPQFLVPLAQDGCAPENLAPETGFEIIKAASAAALHETLHCAPWASAAIAGLADRFPEIGVFEEALR
ncbi:MAG: hypothetical protein H6711_26455 [Myxococcales bacterium]|nr:hypothetical protein [Myxococcales bacterium]